MAFMFVAQAVEAFADRDPVTWLSLYAAFRYGDVHQFIWIEVFDSPSGTLTHIPRHTQIAWQRLQIGPRRRLR